VSPRRATSWATRIVGGSPSRLGTDVALVAVRVALVWIFTYYGAGKLFGAFHGPGLHRTALYFADTAHLHPGAFFAAAAGVIELGGALLLALGLAARLAGLALLVDQVMAMITVTWVNGINSLSATPGYEFNVTLCVLAVVVLTLGAGRLSVDHLIERRLVAGAPVGEGAPRGD